MMSHVVVWSGGTDSTSLLVAMARTSSVAYPVRAFTVSDFGQVNKPQFSAQRRVQGRLLKLLRGRGQHVKHDTLSILRKSVGTTNPSQAFWWLSFLAPFVEENDVVHFGYIRGDDFWHKRSEFVDLFARQMAFGNRVGVELKFDLEWCSKQAVLAYLKKYRIPKTCWWSCEGGRASTPCGVCNKCKELSDSGHERAGSIFPFE